MKTVRLEPCVGATGAWRLGVIGLALAFGGWVTGIPRSVARAENEPAFLPGVPERLLLERDPYGDAPIKGILETSREVYYVREAPTRRDRFRDQVAELFPAMQTPETRERPFEIPAVRGERIAPEPYGPEVIHALSEELWSRRHFVLLFLALSLGYLGVLGQKRRASSRRPARLPKALSYKDQPAPKPSPSSHVNSEKTLLRARRVATAGTEQAAPRLWGEIHDDSLTSAIHDLNSESAEGLLILADANRVEMGRLFICRSEIIRAEASGLEGRDAAAFLLSLREGTYRFIEKPVRFVERNVGMVADQGDASTGRSSK